MVVAEEFVSLLDTSNSYIFVLEACVIFAIEYILDGVLFGGESKTVLHESDHFWVFEERFQTRDDWGICECFARMTIGILACFIAVRTSCLRFVWTNIADTGVDAAIVADRTVRSKELDAGFCDLQ